MEDNRTPARPAGAAAVDAPTASEWSLWWATPLPARLYNAAVVLAALAVSLVAPVVVPPGWGCIGATLALVAGGGIDFPELMAAADRELYRAKAEGRNRIAGADPHREPAPLPAG